MSHFITSNLSVNVNSSSSFINIPQQKPTNFLCEGTEKLW